MSLQPWRCRDRLLPMGPRCLIMGIVNVTPDSFSDGGQHATTTLAVEHAMQLVEDGADILDIGGESSRPGAQPIALEEELRRVIPVVHELTRLSPLPISVDTTKAEVARKALQAGACIINDITALRGDADTAEVVRSSGAGVVLMHMQGTPATMQVNPTYQDVVQEISDFLRERIEFAKANGIEEDRIVIDPGIGFGQTIEHTLQLLRKLEEFQRLGRPVCLGVSRKGFIGQITGRPRDQRAVGSAAVAAHAVMKGAAQIVRVHDVAEHRDILRMLEALSTS